MMIYSALRFIFTSPFESYFSILRSENTDGRVFPFSEKKKIGRAFIIEEEPPLFKGSPL